MSRENTLRQGDLKTALVQLSDTREFRTDIQGLRAIAILIVVVNHAGLGMFSGGYVGVDVFFVISGFLITSHLVKSLISTGRIQFAAFYARRARRLLPASFVVLLATLAGSVIWQAPLQLQTTLKDAMATALYVPNLLFARQGTDYLADTTPSLFQQYWSLGVEEQFYLVWPVLILLGFLFARRSSRGTFWIILLVCIGSFALNIVLTQFSQPWAFFNPLTRAWEFGLGALVAFAARNPRWRVHSTHAQVGMWGGLLLIGASAIGFSDATKFPGVAVAIPVLGTVAVILFGGQNSTGAPHSALAARPMQFIGRISYSLYLVHWPLLVLPSQAHGRITELPMWLMVALTAACFPLAWLLQRFVEVPGLNWHLFASARPRRSLAAAGIASGTVVALSLSIFVAVNTMPLSTAVVAEPASAISPPSFTPVVPRNIAPDLRTAQEDNPIIYRTGCHLSGPETVPAGCQFGINSAAPTVVLFGDSHSAHWFPALNVLAERGDITLTVHTKSGCHSVDYARTLYGVECQIWRDAVFAELAETPPEIVLLSNFAGRDTMRADPGNWGLGLERTLGMLPKASDIVVLADTPNFASNPAVCLSAHLQDTRACGEARSVAVDFRIAELEERIATQHGVRYLSLTDYICSADRCDPIIDDALVYRDTNHLTATYSAVLAPELFRRLFP